MTTGDQTKLLSRDEDLAGNSGQTSDLLVSIDLTNVDQSMKGFGAALSNAAAYLIYTSTQRQEVVFNYFIIGANR